MITGSYYFFKDYTDFKPKDIDYIEIVDPKGEFKFSKHTYIINEKCIFYTNKFLTKEELIDHYKNHIPMTICKFLTKEFADYFNITIEDLKQLSHMIDNLDDKHKYLKIIYNAYIENNDYKLTNEQRDNAYSEYKKYRV